MSVNPSDLPAYAKPAGRFRSNAAGALFVVPAALFFLVLLLLPTLAAIALAFTYWDGFSVGSVRWAGVHNFTALMSDPVFRSSLRNTLAFVIGTVVFLNLFGLGAALLIHTRVRGHDFLRVAMFVPLAISPVVTAIIWQQLLSPYGIINSALGDLGFQSQAFLGDPALVNKSVIIVAIWQYSGFDMLLYYAALQGAPQSLLEAATVDGARFGNRLRFVIIPYLRPVIAVVVIFNMIGGWKVFDLVWVLTQGGPNHASDVLATELYSNAFELNSFGYASMIGVVIVVLALVSSLTRRRISGATA
ncbi:MAG: raffinose/stachyose/melibiose transport system permease protein [Gaiellaceae bacterium]|nr:raffinose/stachyose/melibiose transport system permease protein [Gaiellaceae bacterium]